MNTPLPHRCIMPVLCALPWASGALHAQSAEPFPARPVRLIVGFPPGGAADILGRITAIKLTETLGQQVIVDNRGGAGGLLATQLTMRATPDGHTLMLTSNPHAINAALYRNAGYDPVRDFTPIVQVVSTAMVLAVSPSVGFRTVPEMVAQARAQPAKLSYGSGGSGASGHLAMELFKSMARVDILHVPYKGTGPVLNDLIAGQIHMTIGSAAPTLPQVRAGKVRALAVTGRQRTAVMPEIPTVAESGYPEYEVTQWFGMLGPAGLPAHVVRSLNDATQRALRNADTRERFHAQSVEPVGGSPEALGAIVRSEVTKWGRLVRELKLDVQ